LVKILKQNLIMKAIKQLLVCSTVSVLLLGCQKGEDDPFLSLRSRDARVTGTWEMTAMKSIGSEEITQVYGDSTITFQTSAETNFKGNTITSVYTQLDSYLGLPATLTRESEYKSELTINKDGTYTWTEEVTGVSSTLTTYDYDFQTGEFVQGEDSTTTSTQKSLASNSGYWYWQDNSNSKALLTLDMLGTMYLLELSNEQMVWESVSETKNSSNDEFVAISSDVINELSMTWEKK